MIALKLNRMTFLVLAVFLAVPAAAVLAEEPKEKQKPAEKTEAAGSEKASGEEKTEEVRVYTNADLAGPSGSSAAADSDATEADSKALPRIDDPMVWMRKQKANAAKRTERIAAAETAVKTARARVVALEKQLMAVSNPFSARPELDEKEKEARTKRHESALERRGRTQKMLDDARKQVREAEQALTRARTERPR